MKYGTVENTLFLKDLADSTTLDDIFNFKEETVEPPRNNYSPRRVRGTGSEREGYCETCDRWYNMKNSSYWYHMNYKHGINCRGEKYPMPRVRERGAVREGYCEECGEWVSLGSVKKSFRFSWLRHMQRQHRKIKDGNFTFR